MDGNRMKILAMVSEGKISVDEAEQLLERLQGSATTATAVADAPDVDVSVPAVERPVPKNPRFLRVVINVTEDEAVRINVRVPLALLRTGIKLTALLPQQAREQMEEQGIDLAALSQLDTDELIDALAALTVDVDVENEVSIRIFCE